MANKARLQPTARHFGMRPVLASQEQLVKSSTSLAQILLEAVKVCRGLDAPQSYSGDGRGDRREPPVTGSCHDTRRTAAPLDGEAPHDKGAVSGKSTTSGRDTRRTRYSSTPKRGGSSTTVKRRSVDEP